VQQTTDKGLLHAREPEAFREGAACDGRNQGMLPDQPFLESHGATMIEILGRTGDDHALDGGEAEVMIAWVRVVTSRTIPNIAELEIFRIWLVRA